MHIADDTEVGDREDRGVGILVYGDDGLRVLHSHQMLHRARDSAGDVYVGFDGLPRLAHLFGIGDPPGVDDGAGSPGRCLELLAQLLHQLIGLWRSETPTS